MKKTYDFELSVSGTYKNHGYMKLKVNDEVSELKNVIGISAYDNIYFYASDNLNKSSDVYLSNLFIEDYEAPIPEGYYLNKYTFTL